MMRSGAVAVALLVYCAVGRARLDAAVSDAVDSCIRRLNPSEGDSGILDLAGVPDNREQSCLGACLLKEYSAMTETNRLRKAKLLELGISDRLTEGLDNAEERVIAACADRVKRSADRCLVFERYMKCIVDEIKLTRIKDVCSFNKNDRDYGQLKRVVDFHQVPKNRREACTAGCVAKERGLMNQDNLWQPSNLAFDELRIAPNRVRDCALQARFYRDDDCESFRVFSECVLASQS